ncbi:hypothetical protein Tco_1234785 [Tanacetum coccineum]
MSSASSAVTYTSVYINSEPGRAFWRADDEEIPEGGIPWVIVLGYDGLPIQPVAPPSPDYIPGPKEPQTPRVPQDKMEAYVTESDPEEDPEEYEDDETEDVKQSLYTTTPATLTLLIGARIPSRLRHPYPFPPRQRDDFLSRAASPKRLCLSTLAPDMRMKRVPSARPTRGPNGIELWVCQHGRMLRKTTRIRMLGTATSGWKLLASLCVAELVVKYKAFPQGNPNLPFCLVPKPQISLTIKGLRVDCDFCQGREVIGAIGFVGKGEGELGCVLGSQNGK